MIGLTPGVNFTKQLVKIAKTQVFGALQNGAILFHQYLHWNFTIYVLYDVNSTSCCCQLLYICAKNNGPNNVSEIFSEVYVSNENKLKIEKSCKRIVLNRFQESILSKILKSCTKRLRQNSKDQSKNMTCEIKKEKGVCT